MVNKEGSFKSDNQIPVNYKVKSGLSSKIKTFWILNWRIIILVILLIASILFIWWSNNQVDENFTNAFQ